MSYSVTRRNGSLRSSPFGGSIDDVNKAMISPVTSCLNYWVFIYWLLKDQQSQKVPLFGHSIKVETKTPHRAKGNQTVVIETALLVMLPLCPSIMAAIALLTVLNHRRRAPSFCVPSHGLFLDNEGCCSLPFGGLRVNRGWCIMCPVRSSETVTVIKGCTNKVDLTCRVTEHLKQWLFPIGWTGPRLVMSLPGTDCRRVLVLCLWSDFSVRLLLQSEDILIYPLMDGPCETYSLSEPVILG